MFTLQAIVNGQPPEAETSSQVLNIKLEQGFICVQVRLGVMTIAQVLWPCATYSRIYACPYTAPHVSDKEL